MAPSKKHSSNSDRSALLDTNEGPKNTKFKIPSEFKISKTSSLIVANRLPTKNKNAKVLSVKSQISKTAKTSKVTEEHSSQDTPVQYLGKNVGIASIRD